jgi:hypothetical protein
MQVIVVMKVMAVMEVMKVMKVMEVMRVGTTQPLVWPPSRHHLHHLHHFFNSPAAAKSSTHPSA